MPVEALTGLGPVTFRRISIDPPTINYVTDNEFLRVRTTADWKGPTLGFRMRLLRPDSQVIEWEEFFRASDMVQYGEWIVQLTEGFLLSLALTQDAVMQRGRQWVTVELRRGGPEEYRPARVLIKGYVRGQSPLSWPDTPQEDAISGRGNFYDPLTSLPPAGNNVVVVVPVFAQWRVHSISLIMSTAAGGPNRYMAFTMDLGSGTPFLVQSPTAHAGGVVRRYTGSPAFGNYWLGLNTGHMPLPPDLILPGGGKVSTVFANIQAGDQWSGGNMIVEEWRMPY